MEYSEVYRGGGFMLTILGAAMLGISIGIGVVSYMIKTRLACDVVKNPAVAGAGDTALDMAQLCSDILGPTSTLTFAAAGGGTLAFLAGLVVLGAAAEDPGEVAADA